MPWVIASSVHHFARCADLPERARAGVRRQLGLGEGAPGPLDLVAAPALFAFLEAQERQGDRWLSVRAACEELDQQLSGLWHLGRVLPTLGAAVEASVRYNLLTTDVYTWSLASERGITRLTTPDPGRLGFRRFLEFEVVDRIRAVRAAMPGFRLTELALPGEPPSGEDRLADAVRHVPEWGAPEFVMAFDSTFLDHPLPRPDPILERHLRRPLDERLAQLTAGRPVRDRARDLLRTLVETGDGLPDRAVVAAHLGLAERTFTRRLRQEGTSWRSVRDEVLAALAQRWLLRESAAAVAERLGFADGRSFARAFRRQTGLSPGEWRASRR